MGILTRYDLGPFRLQNEMRVAEKLGGLMIICGGKGRTKLKGSELKSEVRRFAEKMKPHLGDSRKGDFRDHPFKKVS